jgi:hypothetical protein
MKIKNINIFHTQEEIEFLAGMDNIMQYESGLRMIIRISQNFPKHTPNLKVQQDYSQRLNYFNFFSVTIEDEPIIVGDTGRIETKDIEKLMIYIKQNKKLLLDYWFHRIDSTIWVLERLRRV